MKLVIATRRYTPHWLLTTTSYPTRVRGIIVNCILTRSNEVGTKVPVFPSIESCLKTDFFLFFYKYLRIQEMRFIHSRSLCYGTDFSEEVARD